MVHNKIVRILVGFFVLGFTSLHRNVLNGTKKQERLDEIQL